ncbi:MAG TPA: FecR domain-containing protein [Gemmatimonadaceae bacterium]|jgi:hypothetical protein
MKRPEDSTRDVSIGAPYDPELEAEALAKLNDPDFAEDLLIIDYLVGELSPEDRARFEDRMRSDSEFRARAESLMMVWNIPRRGAISRKPSLVTHAVAKRTWEKLKERIELEEQGIRTPTLKERRARWRRRRQIFIATIGGLLTMAVGVWLRPQWVPSPSAYVHADAPRDAESSARLPDETQVTLAPGSHLSYLDWFTPHDEREVTLNGEGTFIVARGAREAMTIRGAGVEVSASNARFTIHAYDTEPIAYVIVHEGRAEVRARTVYGTSESLTLSAGEGARVGPQLAIIRGDAPIPIHR